MKNGGGGGSGLQAGGLRKICVKKFRREETEGTSRRAKKDDTEDVPGGRSASPGGEGYRSRNG